MLRNITELETEIGRQKAKSLLKQAGVEIDRDMYDHSALASFMNEPNVSNIGKDKKNLFTLSDTDGLGALKSMLDKVDLDIVRHEYVGQNYITVRNAAGKRQRCKLYTTSSEGERFIFAISGFEKETAPKYYMLAALKGGLVWVLKREDLRKIMKAVRETGFYTNMGGWSCPSKKRNHEGGHLRAQLYHEHVSWLLNSPKRLGL